MAILSDSFSSFELTTQGKMSAHNTLRSVPDSRSISKISSQSALRSVPDSRSISKISFRSELRSVSDSRSISKISSQSALRSVPDSRSISKISSQSALRSVPDSRSISKISREGRNTLKDVTDNRAVPYRLSRFNPTSNPSDFTLQVTGQSVDSNTNQYPIDALYTELSPNEGYLWNKLSQTIPSTITLYFAKQPSIRFYPGESIRIRNVNNSYSEIVTVTNSTFNSVTYTSSNLIPETSGTFIDSGSTLYGRLYFNANNASDSFQKYFYSLMIPGLYLKKYVNNIADNIPESIKVGKIKNITQYKGINEVHSVAQIKPLKVSAIFELKDNRKVYNFKIPFAAASLLHDTTVTLLSKKLLKIRDVPLYLITEKVSNIKFYNNQILDYEKNSRGILAFTYKSVDFSFANTVTTLTKSISTLKSTSETPQSNFLQRKLFTLNSIRDKIENINFINKGLKVIQVSDRRSVNKIILPLKAVLSTYGTPYRVDALYLKSQVSTNVAPINARENLYYATLAPGLRNKATYIHSSNYASYNTNISSNRIENFYDQSLVSTNVAPVSPREVLYYVNLARGLRNKATYIHSSSYDFQNANFNSNIIENFYNQSLVSTNVAPVSPREVLYYVNLARGLRNKATYIHSSSYDFQNANFNSNIIENFYSQSLVSTNVAPTNARENLYYASLAPGIRSSLLYPASIDYAHVDFNVNVGRVANYTQVRSISLNTSLIVPSYYATTDNLNNYNFSILITGQSLDSSISRYSLDSLYFESSTNENYIWNKLSPTSSGTKTLYFANQTATRFKIGDTIRVYNRNSGYSELINLTGVTSNSVSYTSNNLIPEISGTYIDPGSEFYNITLGGLATAPNAIKNLYTAFSTPGKRSTKSFGYGLNSAASPSEIFKSYHLLNRIAVLKSIPHSSNLYHLSRFSPDGRYDVRLEITGQSLDSSIKTENVETLYIENSSDEGYIWTGTVASNSSIKTLYFSNQNSLKFSVGEVIRIRNINSGYTTDVIVTNCTFNSVSYTSSNLLPEISRTFVESGSSLIPQSTVRTNLAPTNPRERLYYATMTPGYKAKYILNAGYSSLIYNYNVASILGKRTNPNVYFSVGSVFYGKIDKFIVGDFKKGSNKMQDMAATKKAPIQFWS